MRVETRSLVIILHSNTAVLVTPLLPAQVLRFDFAFGPFDFVMS